MIFLFRSEKLYVTEDIRSDRPKSSRGKCICATLGILLVCAAITVAVLIGGNFMILYAFIFLMVNLNHFDHSQLFMFLIHISYAVGVLDPYSMTLIKRDRAINIENQEPSVGAILQSGNNFDSISNAIDEEIKQNSDDIEPEKVFPIGHGKYCKEKTKHGTHLIGIN